VKASHQFPHPARGEEPLRPTDEIGVFEMTGTGRRRSRPLRAVLSERDLGSPGTAVFAGIEGTRHCWSRFRHLVAPSALGTPRKRRWSGWTRAGCHGAGGARAHCGVRLSPRRLSQCRADCAPGTRQPTSLAAAALVSSARQRPLPADAVYFGEVLALSGAVRPVGADGGPSQGGAEARLCPAIVPEAAHAEAASEPGFALEAVGMLANLVAARSPPAAAPVPDPTRAAGEK